MGTIREDQSKLITEAEMNITLPWRASESLSELAEAQGTTPRVMAGLIVWRAVSPDDYMLSHPEDFDAHLDGEQGGATTQQGE